MPELPSGTVTFLFTDIEGSAARWERDRVAMTRAVARHIALLDAAIAAHGGTRFKTVGDAVQAAFPTAPGALAAALDGQRALLAEEWGAVGPLRVRMALHAGDAEPDGHGDYLAAPLNRLARVLAVGHGGQVLLTQAVQQLTRSDVPHGATIESLGEYRLRDLLEPERVFQLLHLDLPADFPPLTSLQDRPNNLPLQPTPFLGREQEVRDVVALVRRPEVRLLTLTGSGGTGKTRLALQAAAEMLDDVADGVWFVSLASLSDPTLVPSAIGTALGVREEGGRPIADRVRDRLAAQHLLLVLDNLEHLLPAATFVGALLDSAPRLNVLATSRIPLRLRAEREYPVPPLGLPDRKQLPPLEKLAQYDSVRLFIERAQAIKPDFAVDNENAPAIAEICHRLDGLPLAIELAAARVRMLPPQAMLARLEQRLSLLTGGARDAPQRHQTLRDTIAWSHDLLGEEERVLFRRLAVFAGGATFEAVEVVANPDLNLDVFGGLDRLVEQNLVRQIEGPEGEPRVVMLETVREFGLEQLEAAGEATAVHARHAQQMLALFAEGDLHLLHARQFGLWRRRLETELDNLRAALSWLSASGDAETGLQLVGAASLFWYVNGHWREGLGWLERMLAGDGEASLGARARALIGLGYLAHHLGDDARPLPALEEALAIFRRLGNEYETGYALFWMGIVAEHRGDYAQAAAWLEESLQIARAGGDQVATAWLSYHLGAVAFGRRELTAARHLYQEALAWSRQVGAPTAISSALWALGMLATIQGEHGQAKEAFRDVLIMDRELWAPELAGTLAGVAVLAQNLGQHEPATRLLGAAEILNEVLGDRFRLPWRLVYKQTTTTLGTRLGPAAFSRAWEAGRALTREQAITEAFAVIGQPASGAGGQQLHIDLVRGGSSPSPARASLAPRRPAPPAR
jgi:predicted ATPase/class 3 adenylate cyclase